MLKRRDLAVALRHALASFPAVLVTGPRQSGKTTFVQKEAPAGTAYVSFDDPLEREFARSDPSGFLARFRGAVALDEVQYVPELFPHLKLAIDRDRAWVGRFLLTGSQRFALMAGVTESLAGRIALLELPPFGLSELGAVPALDQILWTGLYPEPALAPAKRDLWHASYVRTYVERDVRQLRNIQDLRAFESLVALTAARHGQELNAARLAREIGLSQPTVTSWIAALEASYLVARVPPFLENLGKRIVKAPKLYFLDPGIVSYLTRQPSPAAALAGSLGGPLFEGLVIGEVLKAQMARGRRSEVNFWRSHDGLEVDLLVPVRGQILPVEIKLTATPTAAHLRPIERFRALAGEQRTLPGLLVCRVERPRELPGGHLALPWQRLGRWLAEAWGDRPRRGRAP